MEFQRARSDEQRDQRRRTILSTAATMLTEMPVAELSLNELSRRVGLAKSNVLRYFESREAILLELLDQELRDWAAELDMLLIDAAGTVRERGDRIASAIGGSLAARPVMCDLISAQTAVLERNITADVALRHKRATAGSVRVIQIGIERVAPELNDDDAYAAIAYGLFLISATWPHSTPSEALLEAYASDPEVAATRMDFIGVVTRGISLIISGILVQRDEDTSTSSKHPGSEAG